MLDLPRELRDWIWELVLIKPNPIGLFSTPLPELSADDDLMESSVVDDLMKLEPANNKLFGLHPSMKDPALTRTCRSIRSETLSIFYSMNTFEFTRLCNASSSIACFRFLRHLAPLKRLLLKNVQWGDSDGNLLDCELYSFDSNDEHCCGVAAKRALSVLQDWLASEDIVVRDGALQIAVRCSKGGPLEYVSDVSASRFMDCCK